MTSAAHRAVDVSVLALLLVTSVAALVITGSPLPAAALVLLVIGAWAITRAPVRLLTLMILALLLVAHSPQDKPADGYWMSPLELLGAVSLTNLSISVGGPLNFSPVDLLCGVVFALWLLRDGGRVSNEAPLPLRRALAVFGIAIAAFIAFGVSQGGDFQKAYWQVRQLVYIPLLGLLACVTLDGPRDARLLGRIVVGTALVKAACGIYFHFVVCAMRGLAPPYVTTHADTLHFVAAVTLILCAWLERSDRASTRRLFLALPLLYVIVLNDRRIAWIALAGGLATVLALAPKLRAKRLVFRTALIAAPIALLYVSAGWTSKAPVFAPVAVLRSMVDAKEDSSTESRDIENYNLAETLRTHPFGMGFGRPYIERVQGPELASIFSLYRYIPHNSVLWLLAVFGPIGFLALLMPLALGAYYAARAHRLASNWVERAACASALGCIFGWIAQAFGDMGPESWTTVPLLIVALVVPAKIFIARAPTAIPTLQEVTT